MQFAMQLAQGVGQAWKRLSASARVNLVVASLLTVVLVAAMVLIETRPHYVPLFSGAIEPAEASKIQAFLADKGIDFQLKDGGQSILVPADRRSSAVVELGQQGLPTQIGKGFEIFDQQNLLASESQQNIQYQRALAGELMRQLNQFDFVRRSAAYVSIPKEALFSEEMQPAQAAVTLELARPITRGETKGLLQLISAYGGGRLSPNTITIMSTDGDPIHVPAEDDTVGLASSKQEVIENLERQREAKLEKKLREMGAVAASVAVSARVDFTSKKVTENETYDGVVTESMTTNRTVTNEPAAQGAPGAASNPPEGVVQGGSLVSKETTDETVENTQPSTRVTETMTEPGSSWKFSVSATVDFGRRKAVQDASGKETDQQEYVPMSPEEIQTVKAMLASATDPEMSPDDVQVFELPIKLDRLESVEEARQDALREATGLNWTEHAANGGKLLLVLLGFLVVRRLLKGAMVPVAAPVVEEAAIATATPEDVRKRQVAAEVERMSKESPETVAALLRSWMSEAEE